jgi:hypothetical protein
MLFMCLVCCLFDVDAWALVNANQGQGEPEASHSLKLASQAYDIAKSLTPGDLPFLMYIMTVISCSIR